MPTPPEPITKHGALHALLLELFSDTDLRLWLKFGPEQVIEAHLPGENVSRAVLVAKTIEALEQRGLIALGFFNRLMTARPGQKERITDVAEMWLPPPQISRLTLDPDPVDSPTNSHKQDESPATGQKPPSNQDERTPPASGTNRRRVYIGSAAGVSIALAGWVYIMDHIRYSGAASEVTPGVSTTAQSTTTSSDTSSSETDQTATSDPSPPCPDGQVRGRDGKCTPSCADGLVLVAGSCRCPAHMTRVGDRCVTPAQPCPKGMILIRGGTFNTITVPDLCMDQTEVTVKAFGSAATERHKTTSSGEGNGYCNANYQDRGSHPMNCVDWDDARRYCQSKGKRLPKDWEWEWAARGRDEARKYPWGDTIANCTLAVMADRTDGCGMRQTWPVGSRSPAGDTRDGLKDMAGNVLEWTDSSIADRRVMRGGGWATPEPRWLATAFVASYAPTGRSYVYGIRCVKAPRTATTAQHSD